MISSILAAHGCTDDGDANPGDGSSSDAGSTSAGSSGDGGSGSASASTGAADGTADSTGTDTPPLDCSAATTEVEVVVCAAEAFMATLSDEERDAVLYDFSDAVAKTTWSNLPGVARNGLQLGNLGDESRAAAMTLASVALSAEGYEDFVGVLAADDYLAAQGGGMGPGGGAYSSDNYYVAFIGTPSVAGDWMMQLGGHHMAYNITYLAGTGYPVPHHLGAEPKGSFMVDAETYAPLSEEGEAMVAMLEGLDDAQLAAAYLEGQAFADVLVGPDDGSGVLPTDYPVGESRTGVLVSSLDAAQQDLVTAAIEQWVGDYHSEISSALMAEYTSTEALADTYVAWAGDDASGPDPDVSGTYFRIDGPRLWIEVVCQNGVVIQGQTHYHSVFRDKAMDYGNSL